ncbi:hypothetical protein DFO67_11329 [Modicisalibacter xianhensis]|uniref:HTH cro/C1-type domain-containing protein n=1 Tax=Modicisalibacter xianhensis TaxID=442341 RepID=A0A4R8FVP9_9GAMM|nr:helix-turn-helix transcriptional regulator [Halomonas xianhensis]TDX27597.1 hypothetical protein DFO67_11329 [Halomonas xianhensis]
MHDDFAANLRLLCSYYPSIADVCRRLSINRAQFNRYLSGRYRPRNVALRQICTFFGVKEDELAMPHETFQTLVQAGRKAAEQVPAGEPAWPAALWTRGSEGMERYLGRYFEYYRSMAQPGKLLRTLVCLESRGDGIVYQRTERLQPRPGGRPCHNRYEGVALKLAERIFLIDHETINGHELTQTILFPSFQSRVSRLSGLKLGVADNSERMPCCVRVVYERLDAQMTLRQALSQCGLLAAEDPALDPQLLEAVHNDISPGEHHFRARFL